MGTATTSGSFPHPSHFVISCLTFTGACSRERLFRRLDPDCTSIFFPHSTFIQKHRGCIHNQTFTVLLALLTHNDHACRFRRLDPDRTSTFFPHSIFIQKHRGCIHNQTFTVLLALLLSFHIPFLSRSTVDAFTIKHSRCSWRC